MSEVERAWMKVRTDDRWVPYSLRHLCATTWLHAVVPVAEVARRLGHSPDVLLRTYAHCPPTAVALGNSRIEAALASVPAVAAR